MNRRRLRVPRALAAARIVAGTVLACTGLAGGLVACGLVACAPRATATPCNATGDCRGAGVCVDGACSVGTAPSVGRFREPCDVDDRCDDGLVCTQGVCLRALDAGAIGDGGGAGIGDGGLGSDGGFATADGGAATGDAGAATGDAGDGTADGGAAARDGGDGTGDGGGATTDDGGGGGDGGAPVDAGLPAHCFDAEVSGDETAGDCGGSCAGCPFGAACGDADDCRPELVCTSFLGTCGRPSSCVDLLQHADPPPSGTYTMIVQVVQTVEVYCEMERAGGGWTRIADLDFSAGAPCPGDWDGDVLAGHCAVGDNDDIALASFPVVTDDDYREIGGFVVAHKRGSTDAFGFRLQDMELHEPYVDGVSITVGSGADTTHVYSYAAGYSDQQNQLGGCPCRNGATSPDYVGSDFACEAGTAGLAAEGVWYTADSLWSPDTDSDCDAVEDVDGAPAFFTRDLGVPRTDDVDVRLMVDEGTDTEDVGVVELELYVR